MHSKQKPSQTKEVVFYRFTDIYSSCNSVMVAIATRKGEKFQNTSKNVREMHQEF